MKGGRKEDKGKKEKERGRKRKGKKEKEVTKFYFSPLVHQIA